MSSSFFFLTIGPPPRPTLFPYTTLFRSRTSPPRPAGSRRPPRAAPATPRRGRGGTGRRPRHGRGRTAHAGARGPPPRPFAPAAPARTVVWSPACEIGRAHV